APAFAGLARGRSAARGRQLTQGGGHHVLAAEPRRRRRWARLLARPERPGRAGVSLHLLLPVRGQSRGQKPLRADRQRRTSALHPPLLAWKWALVVSSAGGYWHQLVGRQLSERDGVGPPSERC